MILTIIQKKIVTSGLLIFIIISPLALIWYFQKQDDGKSPFLGMHVPSIVVSTLNGTVFLLNYRGKKQILIYFTVECSHCRNELINLDLLYVEFKPQIDIFAISLSKLEKTMLLLSSRIVSFPVFQKERTSLEDSIKVVDVPTMLFIDEQRILRHIYVGERTIEEDRKLLYEFSNENFTQKQ